MSLFIWVSEVKDTNLLERLEAGKGLGVSTVQAMPLSLGTKAGPG